MANQAEPYTTEAIACGLSDVAGWLENEGGRDKHARTIRLGVERLRELGATATGTEGEPSSVRTMRALKELSDAATPGLWYTVDTPWGDGTWIVAGNPDPHAGTMVCDCQDANESRPEDGPSAADDAAFIATLVTAYRLGELVPASLAALGTGEGSGGAGWMPISEAPADEEVEVRAGKMTFLAKLVPGGAMDTSENVCDQWVATRDGEHPPCWSDGCCWTVNEAEDRSLWPEAWRPADASVPAPHPQAPNTLSEVEEARALLEGLPSTLTPQQSAERLRAIACWYRGTSAADGMLSQADAIEAALATLRASQEQDSEVRDV